MGRLRHLLDYLRQRISHRRRQIQLALETTEARLSRCQTTLTLAVDLGINNCHINEIYALIEELENLNERNADQEDLLSDYRTVFNLFMEIAYRNTASLNDASLNKSIEEAVQNSPATEDNSFPMNYFMDYCEPTPNYNVGDLVWAVIPDDEDPEKQLVFESVITAKIIDIFGVTYRVAPYNTVIEHAMEIDYDFEEDDLYEENPAAKSRFSIVR